MSFSAKFLRGARAQPRFTYSLRWIISTTYYLTLWALQVVTAIVKIPNNDILHDRAVVLQIYSPKLHIYGRHTLQSCWRSSIGRAYTNLPFRAIPAPGVQAENAKLLIVEAIEARRHGKEIFCSYSWVRVLKARVELPCFCKRDSCLELRPMLSAVLSLTLGLIFDTSLIFANQND